MAGTADGVRNKPADAMGRIDAVLRVAASVGTGVRIEALSDLLPEDAPATPTEITGWLAPHTNVVALDGDLARHPARGTPAGLLERRARGREFLQESGRFVRAGPSAVLPLLRSVGVTGSTAFGEPEEGDDLDLLIVTRPGSMWFVLAYAYMMVRLRRHRAGAAKPVEPCLNYVMEEDEIRREFSRARGFQFAREALTAQPVHGEEYYLGLIGSAPWLRTELPRLYGRWARKGTHTLPPVEPAPFGVRAANLLLYPLLASYLHIVGAMRNRRLRREGRWNDQFETVATPRRLTFESRRFAAMGAIYARASPAGDGDSEARA